MAGFGGRGYVQGFLVLGEAKENPDTIGFAEAAARLGISESTLKTVLERGFLKSVQDVDGQWRIYLDPLFGTPVPADGLGSQAMSDEATESGTEFPTQAKPDPRAYFGAGAGSGNGAGSHPSVSRGGDMGRRQPAADGPSALSSGLSALENVLAEEIQYLRRQIERRDEAIAKKDGLIDDLIRRLTTPTAADGGVPGSVVLATGARSSGDMRRAGEGEAEADRWHRELDRAFQELRGLLARRPKAKS